MNPLDLTKLGAHCSANSVHFGIYLPWISFPRFTVHVRVIREADQFLQQIQPVDHELTHVVDPVRGDFWETTVPLPQTDGELRYIYRYQVTDTQNAKVVDWVIDPFAREYGCGKMSAFTQNYAPHPWSTTEDTWRTHCVHDLVAYELHLGEFAGSIEGAIARLDYVRDLGVNCVEIMPVSNIVETVRWGFQPIGFFGVDDRFGNRRAFQRFVDAAHQRDIAVVLDVVYGHTGSSFPYSYLYRELGFAQNPFHAASFGTGFGFGERTDFSAPYVEDFFFTASLHWLDCYHVDGFRFDCVPEYWDPDQLRGYHKHVYEVYRATQERVAAHKPAWQRFERGDGTIGLILCAEQLLSPRAAVNDTYGNGTWQSETADAAERVAKGTDGNRHEDLVQLGLALGLEGYWAERKFGNDRIPKTAFQYLENHDKPRFLLQFGSSTDDFHIYPTGRRENWWQLQPYLMGLLLAKGVPMLWQGQELCENNALPPSGEGRVGFFRPMRWELFYDEPGSRICSLVRRVLAIRNECEEFRRGQYYFVNDGALLARDLLVFRRTVEAHESIVLLNFGMTVQNISLPSSRPGIFQDLLGLGSVAAGATVRVPGNYGCILRG